MMWCTIYRRELMTMRQGTRKWLTRGGAAAMSGARVLIGSGAVRRPAGLAQSWLGEGAGAPELSSVRVLGRASGGRDFVLGLGGLWTSLRPGPGVGGWIAAGGVVDAIDGVSTALDWDQLPAKRRVFFAVAAGGTAVLSFLICAGLAGSESEATESSP